MHTCKTVGNTTAKVNFRTVKYLLQHNIFNLVSCTFSIRWGYCLTAKAIAQFFLYCPPVEGVKDARGEISSLQPPQEVKALLVFLGYAGGVESWRGSLWCAWQETWIFWLSTVAPLIYRCEWSTQVLLKSTIIFLFLSPLRDTVDCCICAILQTGSPPPGMLTHHCS